VFQFSSPGRLTFGDLASKQPVAFATDLSLTWSFPVPILSPAGAAVPGQTLTKSGNGLLSAEPPMHGTALLVGDRLLVTGTNPGIWVVVNPGGAGAPWVLMRATDADTPAELIVGATVSTTAFALDGTLFNAALAIFGFNGIGWEITPSVLRSLTVLNGTALNALGALDPGLTVNGRIVSDTVTLDNTNRDITLARSATKTLTIDDNAGGLLALIRLRATGVVGPTPVVHVYIASTTWATPAGLLFAVVELVGGGGGGGDASTDATIGGGGGGGGAARKLLLGSALSGNYTVTVGNGGIHAAAGVASSFAGTGIITITGNGGGAGVTNSGAGGGGTGVGGDLNIQGGDGGSGGADATSADGRGGSSHFGPGGAHGPPGGGGRSATGFGGGGGGGHRSTLTTRNGGSGTNGAVIVTEFYGP